MKIRLVFLTGICSLMIGCEILSLPLKLFTELLPLAIQYAPYALMFVEAPAKNEAQTKEPNDFEVRLAKVAKQPVSRINSLTKVIKKELHKRNNKIQYVVAIHLDSPQKIEKINYWLIKNSKNYKIHYMITAYDEKNPINQERLIQVIKKYHNKLKFQADGPLQNLCSTKNFSKKVFKPVSLVE